MTARGCRKQMKSHSKDLDAAGERRVRSVKVLLVGHQDEFEEVVMHHILDASQPWIAYQTASLLGALEKLRSSPVDFVLLGRNFRNAELELFLAEARRNGFAGLVLQAVSAGEAVLALPGISAGPTLPPASTPPAFTSRQKAVLAAVCNGWTNQEVARALQCSEGAVKAILQQIFQKVGVRKRAQVVRMAMEKGLLDVDGKRPALVPAQLAKQGDRKPISVGHFVLDIAMHRVWVRGAEVHLTPKEFWLLALFAGHPGELMESHSLCETFWRNPTAKHDALRVLIGALRAKIEVSKIPQYLVTERSFGYRFHPLPTVVGTDGGAALPGDAVC
jgi:DNA-binding CsgD family transcriptional regulator/DNA-binding winged helix-turn-helix (wHTH) protein